MRTKLGMSLAAAGAAFVLGTASPAAAITYGEPDAGEHPYVGFMIFYDPAEQGWFSCSGALLDPDTFLTAGHCTYGIGTGGQAAGTSGGTDVWVTFEESDALAGWPSAADYPNPAALYAARAAWLENPANGFTQGTAYPHPDYDGFAQFPENYDVGVVELQASLGGPYAELAPLGTVEALVTNAPTPNDAIVENVGYGIQEVRPELIREIDRYKSTSRIVETRGNAARAGNLHTLNNPSEVGGRGGTCNGDSGGPVLVNDTDQIVAVVSFGYSGTCHGADYSWRVDTQNSYDFISQYLGG
ncbi:trypsin-like serine protease [Geodermatophilus sp. SYSU D00691]